jgi:SAM-dependent methyltransferase
MADYHKFIYDTAGRRIIGDFEGAYASCDDVWPSQHETDLFKHRFAAHLLRSLGPGARLADIGAGYGDFVADLLAEGLDATGYEISAAAVKRGRRRFRLGDRLQVASLKNGIPAADRSYDLVVLYGVLWFLLDALDASMIEVKRLLRPKGRFLVSLSMVRDPIGAEIIGSYDDLLTLLRRHFNVRQAIVSYLNEDVAAGKAVAECATDMVVYCDVE